MDIIHNDPSQVLPELTDSLNSAAAESKIEGANGARDKRPWWRRAAATKAAGREEQPAALELVALTLVLGFTVSN